jgi:hypothetical protein
MLLEPGYGLVAFHAGSVAEIGPRRIAAVSAFRRARTPPADRVPRNAHAAPGRARDLPGGKLGFAPGAGGKQFGFARHRRFPVGRVPVARCVVHWERVGRRPLLMFQCGASATCSDLQTPATSATRRPRVVARRQTRRCLHVLRGRYQGRGTAPAVLERRQSRERAHADGHVHRLHRAAPRHGWRTPGQGSGRDRAGGIHHAKQRRLFGRHPS